MRRLAPKTSWRSPEGVGVDPGRWTGNRLGIQVA